MYDWSREGWRFRAIETTRGNSTTIGTLLLAVIGRHSRRPPWFGPTCVITPDGYVLSNFVDRYGTMHPAALVCGIEDMIDGFRRLADRLKLNDKDREELFDQLKKWVSVDHRADPDWKSLRQEAAQDD